MLKLGKVAVTGGLSCGKSSACRFFKEFGAYVVSADEIVHRLLDLASSQIRQDLPSTTNLGQKLISLLGPDIIINHQIDRSQIAKKVFNHPELLQALETLLHPAVREEMEKLYQLVIEAHLAPLFVAEIPLLYETGGERFFDYTIVVQADENTCKQRFQKSTGYENAEYERRMARQLHTSEKARRADFVINNNGSLNEMRDAVGIIYKQLMRNGIT